MIVNSCTGKVIDRMVNCNVIGSCLLLFLCIFICTRLKYSWLLLLIAAIGIISLIRFSRSIHVKKNRVFREGTIGEYVVAGIDEVELFSSTKKSCSDCLSRKNRAGEMEYFHRSVVCMTVGKATACDPGAGNAEVEGRSGKG